MAIALFFSFFSTIFSYAEIAPYLASKNPSVYGDIPDYGERYLSPDFLQFGAGGNLFVTCRTGDELLMLKSDKVQKRVALPGHPSGVAVSHDGKIAYVSIAAPDGKICKIDVESGKILQTVPAHHMPRAIILSPDGRTLYAANQFENKVRAYDANTLAEKASGSAIRDPFSMAYSPLPRKLLVLNQLPESKGGLYEENIAAAVSVLNPDTLENIARIDLPNGSINAQEIIVTQKYAYCTHVIARFNVPTTQVERGWINTNAISVIDIEKNSLVATILIDDIELGAANPYGIAVAGDFLVVAQAGTHEVSVINRPALEQRIEQTFAKSEDRQKTFSDICNDLSFLSGIRKRIVLDGYEFVYAGMYYSDVLNKIDLKTLRVQKIQIGGNENLNEIRKGDLYYHDAALCFQKWLSCVTCHTEVRSDTLNWDLLNDGIGNPKQSKSMLYAHFTPPSMITAVRKDAKVAVRKGIQYIQFTRRPEKDSKAIDAYLSSLHEIPSPYLVNGKLSEAAERGEMYFEMAKCSYCHSGDYYTDMKRHDVGSGLEEYKGFEFDTPTLREVWRTAPYLYDGRARTVFEMLRKFNKDDKHGHTSDLTDQELKELEEFVLSL